MAYLQHLPDNPPGTGKRPRLQVDVSQREIDDPHRLAVEPVSKRESKQLHCVEASDLHAFLLGSKAEELINERQSLFKPLYIPAVSSQMSRSGPKES